MFRNTPYGLIAMNVLSRAENFWKTPEAPASFDEMLRFSAFLSVLPLSGYLFSYTVVGQIWNTWPWIQTTLSVTRGLMCAGLQWMFFATFPLISSLVLDALLSRSASGVDFSSRVLIATYSMTPLLIAGLFVGIPFVGRIAVTLCFATFLYLLYSGYRIHAAQGIIRSAVVASAIAILFALIRQMFVFVIGF